MLSDIDKPPDEFSTEGKIISVLLWIWALAALALVTQAAAGQEKMPTLDSETTLMLVREWDGVNGSLIGWLPNHSAAIQLELLDKTKTQAQHFAPDQVVYIRWPRRPRSDTKSGQILISPTPHTFEGQAWLPVKRDPNIVKIGKADYLIRRFMLGDSKWRLPLRTSAASGSLAASKTAP